MGPYSRPPNRPLTNLTDQQSTALQANQNNTATSHSIASRQISFPQGGSTTFITHSLNGPTAHPQETHKSLNELVFPKLDLNRDEFIDLAELNKSVLNPQIKSAMAIHTTFLKENFNSIQTLSNDEYGPENNGITKADIKLLHENKDLLDSAKAFYEQSNLKLSRTPDELYGSNNIPDIRDFKQNGVGSCFLQAAIGSIVSARPDAIKNIINPNEDGTFSIIFPGLKGQSVTVSAPTEAERLLYVDIKGPGGFWPILLEKAVGSLRQESRDSSIPNQERLDSGGCTAKALNLLTGHEADVQLFKNHRQEQIASELISAKKENRAVCFSAYEDNPALQELGLESRHAYAVIDYNHQSGLVKLSDPLKSNDWVNDSGAGTYKIPLSALMTLPARLSIESTKEKQLESGEI